MNALARLFHRVDEACIYALCGPDPILAIAARDRTRRPTDADVLNALHKRATT